MFLSFLVWFTLNISHFSYFSSMKGSLRSVPKKEAKIPKYVISYSKFLNYLDLDWVKKVDFYKNETVVLAKINDPMYGNYSRNFIVHILSSDRTIVEKLQTSGIDYDYHSDQKPPDSNADIFWSWAGKYIIKPLVSALFIFYFIKYSAPTIIDGIADWFFDQFPQENNPPSLDFEFNVDMGITFDDVAGIDDIREEVEEVVMFINSPERFNRLGAKIPRGVLLVGPPGSGKTMIAKAIASEANVPFSSVSGSSFVEMYVGMGASRVRTLFENAKKYSPCIIFIDEIDAIGKKRDETGFSNDEREQTLNQLLTEMDGFEGNTGIIVIAATNRVDVLDSALVRPGRFDKQITVGLPNVNGRVAILLVHAANKKFDNDVSFLKIAQKTVGFSGAELANLLNESAILATRKKKSIITMQHIITSFERIVLGLEGAPMKDGRIKRMFAYREAGRALIASLLEDHPPVEKVSLLPRGKLRSLTWFTVLEDTDLVTYDQLLCKITVIYASRAVEQVVFGPTELTDLLVNDLIKVTDIAREMVTVYGMSSVGPMAFDTDSPLFYAVRQAIPQENQPSQDTFSKIDRQILAILDFCYTQALAIIEIYRDPLDDIAFALIEKEVLDGSELRKIIERYKKLPVKEEYVSYFKRKKDKENLLLVVKK